MTKFANRAKMSISSTGTGNVTLNAAVAGYRTFAAAGIVDTDVIRYIIEDGTSWEIGTGLMSSSATVMARTVEESSNSNAALDLTSAAKVLIGITAQDFEANPAPRWTTTPASTLDLATDGSTAVTLTGVAVDESFPVRYSWDGFSGSTIYDASSLPPQLASAPVINQSTGVTSLVGSSTASNAGTYYHRSRATDGVNTTTQTTAVSLPFIPTVGMTGWYDADFSTIGTSGSELTMTDYHASNSAAGVSFDAPVTSTKFGEPSIYLVTNDYFGFTDSNYSTSNASTMIMIFENPHSSKMHVGGMLVSPDPNRWYERSYDYTSISALNNSAYFDGNPGSATPKMRVNKTDIPTPSNAGSGIASHNALSTTKMNSMAICGVNLGTSGVKVMSEYTSNTSFSPLAMHFRALLIYNRILSNTEIDEVHDYYGNIYGSDMA
jgi:hypothetical protein